MPADTSGEKPQLFCEYDENGNEVARYTKEGFQLRQTFDAMDNLTRQRAGNEPKYFFDTQELQATGIDAPTFAKLDRHYRYDLAQQTIQSEERNEKLNFTLNRNGQITEVIENHRLRESYRYDENGYLAQRHIGLVREGQLHDPFSLDYDKQPQIIQNANIYKKGNQLDRLSETVYEYDEAGRVISRTKNINQRNEQHETFVWNGFNQLTIFNDKFQNQWHYKYDGLGRRIEKYSERNNTTTKYIWDGDQLALTLTFKQDRLTHKRHSVFNGWELLAQQDNQITHYAVSQPNGKILGLFTPDGELAWKAEPTSLWGLYLKVVHHHRSKSAIDPEMLFAGQWLDAESGLAYNRFRYYDPETGNYLCLDPIGLNGGETPYSYVHNPLDWVDLFGLAGCPSLNRKQALNKAKDLAGIPRSQQPNSQWTVGNDASRRGQTNYRYSQDKASHGRYYEYTDANGHKKVVVDHTNDPRSPYKHTHAGRAKANPRTYNFKENRYQKIINQQNNDHHIYYK